MMGDTVRLDITKLYPLALPDDKYYWNLHPMFQNTFDINTLKMDKELTVVIDEKLFRISITVNNQRKQSEILLQYILSGQLSYRICTLSGLPE